MTDKQLNYLEALKNELQESIDKSERRKKLERKLILETLKNIIDNTEYSTSTFSVLVEISNYGFINNVEWQHYIWQNTVLQNNEDFEWVKELGKKM